MIKKLVMVMAAVAMSASVWAESKVVGGVTWYYSVAGNEASIISGPLEYTGTLTIPSLLDGYPVTSIGSSAFENCSDLTSVTIPSSVTSIGTYAFYGCSGLVSVTIPSGVTSIRASAFNYCSSLVSITVDSENSFYSSRDGVLFDKAQAELICCPGGKTGEVTIPTSVTSIGDRAFYSCSGLTSVTMPSSVTSIGDRAFYSCSGLTSVAIPSSVTSIGASAFSGCSGLTSVAIPSNVESIGASAFSSCSGLASITVDSKNSSYSSRDDILFDKTQKVLICCPGGKTGEVTIPTSVTSIGSDAFYYCRGLTSLTIPLSVESIESYAFYSCSGLTSLKIPSSLTNIGGSAFRGCDGLADANGFVIVNGVLYDYCGSATSVKIPSSVKGIGSSAFAYYSEMTSVTIPSSVASIGSDAFSGCSGLTSVKIPSGVTSIESSTFWNCSALKSVVIPDSVTSIGSYAFSGCSALTSVAIPDGVTSIGSSAFSGCSGLTSVAIPACVSKLSETFPDAYDKIRTIIIGAGVTSIDNDGFSGCKSLTSVTIPAGMASIGYFAFSNCVRLVNVYFKGVSVPDVAENAFEGCNESLIVHVPYEWEGTGDSLCGYPVVRDGSAGDGDEWVPASGVWSSKYTFNGLVYDQGNVPCGLVQIVTAVESKKGVKVKGFMMLGDGKKVSLKTVTVPVENGVLNVTTKVGKLGTIALTVGGNGFFGKLDSLKVTSAAVGEDTGMLKSTVTMSYFEEVTGKLKKRSFALGGITVGREAAGTLIEKKTKAEKSFYADVQ